MKVQVVPFDPVWARIYKVEAHLLRSAVDRPDVEVHHIGSTAIPGIFAKPIIDILLVVPDLEMIDARMKKIVMLGYEAMGEYGIPARRYFRKNSSSRVRTHRIYSFVRGSAGTKRHLAFRDYMNSHREAAEAYGSLKLHLASRFPNDIEAYMAGKDAFVKQHEDLALAWFAADRPCR